ncbi:hypothetical protein Mapa_005418 [Marchantia paleacea]|nr:hypothetical protein Mapa_005418 [Marchantia paleacea]
MQNGKESMHVYARPPAGRARSPPLSPIHSPRHRLGRTRSGRQAGGGPTRPYVIRLIFLLFSCLLRRHAVLLLAPVIYISGMLLYMGTLSLDMPSSTGVARGSVYRSPEVFEHLWPAMEADNDSSFGVEKAWEYAATSGWRPCLARESEADGLPESNGYILIEANGGLNQQRSSICNAVAVAHLLNATLVIPHFHLNSVWQDNSKFGDIYDEKYFIESLAEDVRVVKKLPDEVLEQFGNMSNIYNFKVKAWTPADYYLEKVKPKLLEAGVVRFSPFANRLAYDKIPPKVQQIRCKTNFEALRFAKPIASLADVLVKRMVEKSSNSGGKYIAIHLRFEEDMVAFSCCIYDGGEQEKIEMDAARERGWRGKFTRNGRVVDPAANRVDGQCPLTPLEVGMILRGMGFRNTTPIYIAAGKIYKAEKTMLPLRQMFPYLQTKETLLSAEELAPYKKHSSRMAALDYTVCLQSEVFVSTKGGNFPQILVGHRRYLNNGHSKTIRPDTRKLAVLLDDPNISWAAFSEQLRAMRIHGDMKGHELRKSNASIYKFPAPDCMCENPVLDTSRETNMRRVRLLL